MGSFSFANEQHADVNLKAYSPMFDDCLDYVAINGNGDDQMLKYRIIPLKVGEFQTTEKSNFTYMKNQGQKIKAPIIMYLIQNGEKNFLVDVGCGDEAWCKQYHHPIVQTEDMKPLNALKKVGMTPDDIDAIILTHLHWDHCFNLDLFPKSKVYVQKKEIMSALFPLKTEVVFYEGFEMGLKAKWIEALPNFIVLNGDAVIAEGVEVKLLPGHTRGFQGVIVETEKGKYLIASDTIPLLENLEDKLFGMIRPSGIHVDLEQYYKTLGFIQNSGYHVLPGHDERAFEHKVYPIA